MHLPLRSLARSLALLVIVARCASQGSPPTIAAADVSGASLVPMAAPVLDCIGSSHGELLMWAPYREHVRRAAADIGFKRLRGHGVLSDDLSTYLSGRANLWAFFDAMDWLRSLGMRPILELSFMPRELASNVSADMMHYRANISPPANATAWGAFIAELFTELISRYGAEELREWYTEVWNEPNCGFWTGSQADYFSLYSVTARAIRSVDSQLRVGGPATCQLGWLPEFLAYCNASGAPLSHVTSHLYPTDGQAPKTRDGFASAVAAAAALVAAQGAGRQLLLTEFNAGLWMLPETDGDSAYSAAMLVHTHLALQGIPNLGTASFWSVSDVFDESGVDSTPWHNGYGIQTVHGVPKPVYRAFQMLAALPPTAAAVRFTQLARPGMAVVQRHGSASAGSLDVLIAVQPSGAPAAVAVTALVANFDVWNATLRSEPLSLRFEGIPAGATLPAAATLQRIDSAHANGRAAWLAQGSPRYPSAAQLSAQLSASELAQESLPITLTTEGATLTARIDLPDIEPFAVSRVSWTYTTV